VILSAHYLGQAKTGSNRGIYPRGARCTTCADTSLRGPKSGHFCRASREATTSTRVTQGSNSQSNRSRRAISGAYSTYTLHLRFVDVEIHDLVLNSHLPNGSPFSQEMCRVDHDGLSGAPGGVIRKQAFAQGTYSVGPCAKVRRSKKNWARCDECGVRSKSFVPRDCALIDDRAARAALVSITVIHQSSA
jgi:hypothetical protein